MTTPMPSAQALMEKIQSLPTDQMAEAEDFVDSLKQRARERKVATTRQKALEFPVDDLGPWPKGWSLHREDMYGDHGR